jgi:LNS2 (Lipin/Ned1/Smp2)
MSSRRTVITACCVILTGCGVSEATTSDEAQASEVVGALGAPLFEMHCSVAPPAGKGSFRHLSSKLISALGGARHRGIDVVVPASAQTQTLRGDISYGVNDKALEDEWVQLYGCVSGAWVYLGPTLTDGEGHFSLSLTGNARLPQGLRDLAVSVWGDRTSARFTSVVVPTGMQVAVSDVDGTLTTSENAFPESLVTGATVVAHAGAAAALTTLHDRGFAIVYLTARGRYFTADTQAFLAAQGFPHGALRLAPSLVTAPGAPTVDYKVGAMTELGVTVGVGIGNRQTDLQAYGRVGVAGNRTFLKLPEFSSELQADLAAGRGVGFTSYTSIASTFATF